VFHLFTQFGDSSSGLGALGIGVQPFLIQLGTFVVAFLVLRQWAFKPIIKALKERRETIEKGVQLGEQMKKEQAEMEEQVAEALHKARAQADDIIAAAQVLARDKLRAAEDAATKKAENLIDSAKNRIAVDTARARKELERDVVGLIAEATEAIIDEKVDAKKDAALIEKALGERQTA
jgi:F-type H+-transporting ATPase subunit b